MVSENVRRHRHARNLSQLELANACRLHVHTIERVERGRRCTPETLARLALAFNVKPAELLDAEEVA